MKLFRKLDEMELEIKHKGNMAGLIFLNLALIALIIKGIICNNSNIDPYIELLIGELLVVFFAKLIHRKNYGDDGWKKSLVYFIVGAVMLFVIMLVLTCSLDAALNHLQPQG